MNKYIKNVQQLCVTVIFTNLFIYLFLKKEDFTGRIGLRFPKFLFLKVILRV